MKNTNLNKNNKRKSNIININILSNSWLQIIKNKNWLNKYKKINITYWIHIY